MKPTALKPAMRVILDGGHGALEMVFVRRDRQPCRAAVNYFRCERFRGLYGPADDGLCTVSDYRVSRFVSPVAASRPNSGHNAVISPVASNRLGQGTPCVADPRRSFQLNRSALLTACLPSADSCPSAGPSSLD